MLSCNTKEDNNCDRYVAAGNGFGFLLQIIQKIIQEKIYNPLKYMLRIGILNMSEKI